MNQSNWPLRDILLSCIEANEAMHRKLTADGMPKHRGAPAYHFDYRTIKLDIGQRSGKSSLIHELATEDDVVLFPSAIKQAAFILMAEDRPLLPQLHPISMLSRTQVKPWKRIWIEDPTALFAVITSGHLYELVSVDYDQLFIMLG